MKKINKQSPPLQYHTLFRTAEGMFGIDPGGKILFWNSSAQTLLGFSPQEVIGKSCHEIIDARDQAGHHFCSRRCAVITMSQKSRPIYNYDSEVTTKEGEKIWINTSIFLILNPETKQPVIIHLLRKIPSPDGKPLEPLAAPHYSWQKQPVISFKYSPLTPREREVLTLMARSLAAKEIADQLGISTETSRIHIKKILKKLNAHSRLEAIHHAIQQGLLF